MRTKKELIDALIDHTNQSRVVSETFVEALGDILRASLVEDGEFLLPGVGKFTVKEKPARTGRNPATGASIEIAARKSPAFSPIILRSPVKMRPVRLAPFAAGARPTIRECGWGSPQPGTGRPQ